MARHLSRVRRLRVAVESAGSSNYAQELSGSIASFDDVHFLSAEPTLTEEMLPDEGLVQSVLDHRQPIVGRRTCALELAAYMTSGGALDDAASPAADAEWGFGKLLQTIMGGYLAAAGSTESGSASSTASSVTVDTGHGARWGTRTAAGIVRNGRLECRPVDSVAGDVLSIGIPFGGAPANAVDVYNARTFHFVSDPDEALQFLLESADREAIHWLLGMQGTVAFAFTPMQNLQATFSLQGADWKQDNDVGTPVGGSAIAVASYDGSDPIPFRDSCVHLTPVASPQATDDLDVSTIELALNFAYEPIGSPCGVNGVRRMHFNPQRPLVTGSFVFPKDSGTTKGNIRTWQDARANRTSYRTAIQVGHVPGAAWLFECPIIRITDVSSVDANGIDSIRVAWEALNGGTSSERARSPIAIHAF